MRQGGSIGWQGRVWPTQRQGLSKDQRSSDTLQRGKVEGDEEDEDGGSQSK